MNVSFAHKDYRDFYQIVDAEEKKRRCVVLVKKYVNDDMKDLLIEKINGAFKEEIEQLYKRIRYDSKYCIDVVNELMQFYEQKESKGCFLDFPWLTDRLLNKAIGIFPDFVNVMNSTYREAWKNTINEYGEEKFLYIPQTMLQNSRYDRDVFCPIAKAKFFSENREYAECLGLSKEEFTLKNMPESFIKRATFKAYYDGIRLNRHRLAIYDINGKLKETVENQTFHAFAEINGDHEDLKRTDIFKLIFDAQIMGYSISNFEDATAFDIISIRKDERIPNVSFVLLEGTDSIVGMFPAEANIERDYPEEYKTFLKIMKERKGSTKK